MRNFARIIEVPQYGQVLLLNQPAPDHDPHVDLIFEVSPELGVGTTTLYFEAGEQERDQFFSTISEEELFELLSLRLKEFDTSTAH